MLDNKLLDQEQEYLLDDESVSLNEDVQREIKLQSVCIRVG